MMIIKDGQTFVKGTGACICTTSGTLVAISETAEGTIIAVAFKGINVIEKIGTKKAIRVEEIYDFKQYPGEILAEIQQVIDNYHLGTLRDN
jgi:hypothetical protein